MQNKINKYSSTLFNITKDHDMIKTVVEQISIIKQLYKRYANFRLLCESKRIDNTLKHTIRREMQILVKRGICVRVVEGKYKYIKTFVTLLCLIAFPVLYVNIAKRI